ncbi:hypothetical protein RchiOBHm_Chr1g0382711 [Rosa chinensis]|uniref:Uncharacterized protein n=1 Tax=Rosa chinensis TaxID=74649 RepID=A0A2P6SPG7_ROSCH|nr:hypothetical protein RchiOBHm_Chr1g0382711 [Rosa chinensis]
MLLRFFFFPILFVSFSVTKPSHARSFGNKKDKTSNTLALCNVKKENCNLLNL